MAAHSHYLKGARKHRLERSRRALAAFFIDTEEIL